MDATEVHEIDQMLTARRDQAEALAKDVTAYHAVLVSYGKLPEALVTHLTRAFADAWVGGVTNPTYDIAIVGEDD